MFKKFLKLLWENKASFLLILLGSFTWALTMFKSGFIYQFGMGFWGPNGHDGVWHISLAESLSRGSLHLPIFSGENVVNYHIGFDLILGFLHIITGIPITNLYFQILPFLFALSLGLLVVFFLKLLGFKLAAILASLFFVYFGGNLGWLVTYLRYSQIAGGSMFWAQPNILTLINPPYVLSLIFILIGLCLVKKNKIILSGVVFALLIQIKAYASVLILPSLFISGAYLYLKKRDISLLKIGLLASAISLFIFLPLNKDSHSLFVFKPFWFLETMMDFTDRFDWPKYGQAMQNYKLAGNYIKAVSAYILAFVIFWYGNLGTRFIAEIYLVKNFFKKSFNWEFLFIFSIILLGTILPMLFVQKGTAWNTIQFFYYSLFFLSLVSGLAFSQILKFFKHFYVKLFLIFGLLFFNLPTTFDALGHYLPPQPPAKISTKELEALNYLRLKPDGLVLVAPFNKDLTKEFQAPKPLYAYESTAYVSAFSKKNVFLEDEVNLEIMQIEWKDRKKQVNNFFQKPDKEFLSKNNIRYVYIPKDYKYSGMPIDKIFENEEILIYELE